MAKGWAADETVAHLSAFGPALMDAGGDIAVSGPRLGATPWNIGAANPFFPDERGQRRRPDNLPHPAGARQGQRQASGGRGLSFLIISSPDLNQF